MIRVLFVCLGNICRSPMAEFIMKSIVSERSLSDRFYIASAATSTEEIWNGVGNPVYPPAKTGAGEARDFLRGEKSSADHQGGLWEI